MKHRFRGSTIAAIVGLSLLVAAALANSAASAPTSSSAGAARGGTFRYDSRSDFDYIDPALAYFNHSWQMEDAVQLNLLGFPDKDGPAGSRLRAELRSACRSSRRTARPTRSGSSPASASRTGSP
jgi:ABC-type oligopeptide transport system substrate-binding subunit